ncbi:hypothetical protein C6P46_001247 [Rhodotorula mucilaginosa]|uniref:Uncharacterized protein n=1 Tax=Rhodotorula mucilaginosa TaxID=5537 RepID=A0A9P6W7F1_RHOMI|nr:hypothetical protein C6P46_001247 [Rhodotorula mucilaginosa]
MDEQVGSTHSVPLSPATATLPEPLPDVTKIVHVPETRRRIARRQAVGFLRSPDGRDAALRLVQYTLRLALTYQRRTRHRKVHERLLAVVSLLAAIRRVAALHQLLVSLLPATEFLGLASRPARLPNEVKPAVLEAIPGPRQLVTQDWLDAVTRITCQSLDVASLLASNIYLFSRLGLVPLSIRTTRRADKVSDFATLLAAAVGLASVARKRAQLYQVGKLARKNAIRAESRLEELDFWEQRRSRSRSRSRQVKVGSDPAAHAQVEGKEADVHETPATEIAEEEEEERAQLRDRVRQERRTLRGLRHQLGELWWERLRLGADGLFALYDALELSVASESVKSLAGITAAGIEFSQVWTQHFREGKFT